MSGTEALIFVQTIDACIGITNTILSIARAVRDAQGLPLKLRDLLEKLPVIEELLESAKDDFEDGKIADGASNSATPILKQCEKSLGELQEIFRKACPKDKDDRSKRIWRGAKTAFFGRDSQLHRLLVEIQENLKLLEQKEIYAIGDKLDELQELTEALSYDDNGRYIHSGAGNIVANEGGTPTNYVQGGSNNRQINNPGVYNEGPSGVFETYRFKASLGYDSRISIEKLTPCALPAHTHNYPPPARPETPPNPLSNVPFRRGPNFVERTALSAQIRSKLSIPASRVALVGLGGVGKSQLAVEYARQLRQQSPRTSVFWIHASNATRFDQGVADVAEQLKIPGRKDANATVLLTLLYDWLRREEKGSWLLCLDNVDDARFLLERPATADDAQLLRRRFDYFPACDHGSLLLTSRRKDEALKLVYHGEIIDVLSMNEDEAEALLQTSLGQSDPDCRRLARALDCIPLAMMQAAAYIRESAPRYSAQRYCEAMEQSRSSRTSLLRRDIATPSRDEEASNSVLLTWQISFEHLHTTRKSAANLLSLMSFCDRFAIPEILLRVKGDETECSDQPSGFDNDLMALRSFSFISHTPDAQTWEMHRLVQDATQMWLEDRGESDNIRDLFVHRLSAIIPVGNFEDWPVCRILFPHAKKAAEQKPVDQNALLEWATVMYKAGCYSYSQGNLGEALAMAIASRDVRTQCLGDRDPLMLDSLEYLAVVYREQVRLTDAEELQKNVVAGRQAVLGAEHPDTLTSMNNLAIVYRRQDRLEEAEHLYLEVLETSRRVLGTEHPDTLNSMNNLAWVYGYQDRLEEAEHLLSEVLDIQRKVLGTEYPDTLSSMCNLALIYRKQERWVKAEELAIEAVAWRKKVLGMEHPHTQDAIKDLVWIQQGRAKAASTKSKWKRFLKLPDRTAKKTR